MLKAIQLLPPPFLPPPLLSPSVPLLHPLPFPSSKPSPLSLLPDFFEQLYSSTLLQDTRALYRPALQDVHFLRGILLTPPLRKLTRKAFHPFYVIPLSVKDM